MDISSLRGDVLSPIGVACFASWVEATRRCHCDWWRNRRKTWPSFASSKASNRVAVGIPAYAGGTRFRTWTPSLAGWVPRGTLSASRGLVSRLLPMARRDRSAEPCHDRLPHREALDSMMRHSHRPAQTFSYRTSSGSVSVVVGMNAWSTLPQILHDLRPSQVIGVTHASLQRRFGREVSSLVRRSHAPFQWLRIPDGERSKSIRTAFSLWRSLARIGADRGAVLLLVGGGVVGDLGGFVAAGYLRGVRFVSLPTTALAQADSCLGGKTGINLPEGKNLVGHFWHPSAILCDLRALRSLPVAEWRNGLAEVVKCAAIQNTSLFRAMEDEAGALARGPSRRGAAFIAAALRIKAGIVERDERESGDRMLLNFGHTFGHAYETLAGYGRMPHGEAVARGMATASRLAVWLGLSSPLVAERITQVLRRLGLPTAAPVIPMKKLLEVMHRDKKRARDRFRLVLTPRIGEARVFEVPVQRLQIALARDWGSEPTA